MNNSIIMIIKIVIVIVSIFHEANDPLLIFVMINLEAKKRTNDGNKQIWN